MSIAASTSLAFSFRNPMAAISRKRIVEFVLYIGISLLIAGIFLGLLVSGVDALTFNRWLFLFFLSLGVFGFWIEQNRSEWKTRLFWPSTFIGFAVHLVIWSTVLWHTRHLGETKHLGRLLELAVVVELGTVMVCWNSFHRAVQHRNNPKRNVHP
jgi:hypothetical protein